MLNRQQKLPGNVVQESTKALSTKTARKREVCRHPSRARNQPKSFIQTLLPPIHTRNGLFFLFFFVPVQRMYVAILFCDGVVKFSVHFTSAKLVYVTSMCVSPSWVALSSPRFTSSNLVVKVVALVLVVRFEYMYLGFVGRIPLGRCIPCIMGPLE